MTEDERKAHAEEQRLKKNARDAINRESKKIKNVLAVSDQIARIPAYATLPTSMTILKNELKRLQGTNVVIVLRSNGVIKKQLHYDVPENNFNNFWKKSSRDWLVTSNQDVFEGIEDTGELLIYPAEILSSKVSKNAIVQYFADGIEHCCLTPILNWAKDWAASDNTKNRKVPQAIINKLIGAEHKDPAIALRNKQNSLMHVYRAGVPDSALQSLAEALRITIRIILPFSVEKWQGKNRIVPNFIECIPSQKPHKVFEFINTRLNHLELKLNDVVLNNNIIQMLPEEIMQKKMELFETNTYCQVQYGPHAITSLTTLEGKYVSYSKYKQAVDEFEKKTGLCDCYLDDIKNKRESAFIRRGTHYNCTVDFQQVESEFTYENGIETEKSKHIYNAIDQYRAYASFKTCLFYEGFLGKPSDFRSTNQIAGIGLYLIDNIDFSNASIQFRNLDEKLRIYHNNNVYPSPELKMLASYGVTFDIKAGIWGATPFHFEFTEEMYEKETEDSPRHYAKYAGAIDSHNLNSHYWIKGSEEYYSVLCNNIKNDSIIRMYKNDEIQISYPKRYNYHKGHITAFITAYTRINMIAQLMSMDLNKVIRVCSDGIYTTEKDVECLNCFRQKSAPQFIISLAGDMYCNEINSENDFTDIGYPSYIPNHQHTLAIGCGGGGKTHTHITDIGYINVTYIAPSWKLSSAKKEDYKQIDFNISVHFRLLQSADMFKKEFASSSVLIIDECSMITEQQKQFIITQYPLHKIIFCGDLGYQLPPIEGEEMTGDGLFVQSFNTNFRATCPDLLELNNKLRSMIDEDTSKENTSHFVLEYFKSKDRVISLDHLKQNYYCEDFILTGINSTADYYTNMFKGSFVDKEKYYIKKNTPHYKNGQIVIVDSGKRTTPYSNSEYNVATKIDENLNKAKKIIKHAYTAHSIQGETARYNLYIDMNNMFDKRMLYTCISRAKRLDQIYIIENNDMPLFEKKTAKIYAIKGPKEHPLTYIGSTLKTLDQRIKQHESAYEKWVVDKKAKYMSSFEVLKFPGYKMHLIENYPCNSIEELQEREYEIISSTICVNLNGKKKRKFGE